MSSSTSNSEKAPAYTLPAGHVIAVFVVVAVLVETLCHLHLIPMSAEYKDCWSFPRRGEALSQSNATRIVVVGNSAARMGVDTKALTTDLTSRCGPVLIDRMTVDGSRVSTWRYILEQALWRQGKKVDEAVILFQAGALETGGDTIGPLAQGLAAPKDWSNILNHHLPETSEKMEFVSDSLSAVYASRSKLRDKAMKVAVPGYAKFMTDINRANYEIQRQSISAAPHHISNFSGLKDLLEAAHKNGTSLCFVLYPELETDTATRNRNQTAMQIIRDSGEDLIDLSNVPELLPSHYVDQFHLSAEGEAIFTAKLAEALTPVCKKAAVSRPPKD